MHNSVCGRCETKKLRLITWNTSGKYINIVQPSSNSLHQQAVRQQSCITLIVYVISTGFVIKINVICNNNKICHKNQPNM